MTTLKTLKDYPIVEIHVDEIKKDPSNPNVMTLEQSRGLEKSMMSFGRLKHIVIDQNNVLIDGEHRLEVEKAIGTERVNAIRVEVKDEVERKIIRETLNKLHGTYDKQKESNELLAIFENQRLDELADLLAQPKQDLENLISRYNPSISFEREEDESKLPSIYDTEAFVKRGEIWQLGRHYLMCGDSTKIDDVKTLLNDRKIDMVFTDPPYNLNYDFHDSGMVQTGQRTARFDKIQNDNMHREEFKNFIINAFSLMNDYMNNGSSFYICGRRESTILFNNILDSLGLHIQSWIIWVKEHFNISRFDYHPKHEVITYGWKEGSGHQWYSDRGQTDVWTYERQIGKTEHPNTKPTEMIVYSLRNSTKEHQLVYDPFIGSGSTLIACEQTNRICYGCEIDSHYCSVICKRFFNYTNIQPIRLSDGKTMSEVEHETH